MPIANIFCAKWLTMHFFLYFYQYIKIGIYFQFLTLLVLPCPKQPPGKPEGGWFEYHLESSKYKCPNGYEFLNEEIGQRFYPYWYSNCTIAKAWDPQETEDCVRKLFYIF